MVAALPARSSVVGAAQASREVQEAWPDGLRDLGASIAAGASLTHGLTTLAVTGPRPLRTAFARFPQLSRHARDRPCARDREVGAGRPHERPGDRGADPRGTERGGAIVKLILEDLVAATTKDVKVLDEIEAQGLEMKIDAWRRSW